MTLFDHTQCMLLLDSLQLSQYDIRPYELLNSSVQARKYVRLLQIFLPHPSNFENSIHPQATLFPVASSIAGVYRQVCGSDAVTWLNSGRVRSRQVTPFSTLLRSRMYDRGSEDINSGGSPRPLFPG